MMSLHILFIACVVYIIKCAPLDITNKQSVIPVIPDSDAQNSYRFYTGKLNARDPREYFNQDFLDIQDSDLNEFTSFVKNGFHSIGSSLKYLKYRQDYERERLNKIVTFQKATFENLKELNASVVALQNLEEELMRDQPMAAKLGEVVATVNEDVINMTGLSTSIGGNSTNEVAALTQRKFTEKLAAPGISTGTKQVVGRKGGGSRVGLMRETTIDGISADEAATIEGSGMDDVTSTNRKVVGQVVTTMKVNELVHPDRHVSATSIEDKYPEEPRHRVWWWGPPAGSDV